MAPSISPSPPGIIYLLTWFLLLIVVTGQSDSDLACKDEFPAKTLCKFVDSLYIPQVVNVATGSSKITTLGAYDTTFKMHRDLPKTPVFAFGLSRRTASVPGPTLVAQRGVTSNIMWVNNMTTTQHLFPVDMTLMPPMPPSWGIPLVVHLHGAEVQSSSDGHPDAWYTHTASNAVLLGSGGMAVLGTSSATGDSITAPTVDGIGTRTAVGEVGKTFSSGRKFAHYSYPNQQPAGTYWYHDHTIGMTRLNVLAGLEGFYILKDPHSEKGLNLPQGRYEINLMLQDKSFFPNGSIFIPVKGDNPKAHPHWEPEYFGDHVLVNGKVWPYLNVEARKYRFRILNAANARFFGLSLRLNQQRLVTDSSIRFIQIAADGSYFSHSIRSKHLLIAPGERADIVVDFSSFETGDEIVMHNAANAPYPGGDPPTLDVQMVMKFVVKVGAIKNKDLSRVPAVINREMTAFHKIQAFKNITRRRVITLSEVEDRMSGSPLYGLIENKRWNDVVTLKPRLGSYEIWELVNLTEDTHPIHVHLIHHRVLNRQAIDKECVEHGKCVGKTAKCTCLRGSAELPAPHERGLKDTTQCPSRYVTRLLLHFAPAPGGQFPFDALVGPGYVIHCHILDHEDNDMMRPYVLVR